jgi:hypothetical protein
MKPEQYGALLPESGSTMLPMAKICENGTDIYRPSDNCGEAAQVLTTYVVRRGDGLRMPR